MEPGSGIAAAGGRLPYDTALADLASRFRGSIITTDDGAYESRRHVWNDTIDRRPRVILMPSGTADVVSAVRFAREQGLPLSVRGGGHNAAGTALVDDGVVIDLSAMKDVHVDAASRIAHVGGGAKLGDLDHETHAFGLAVPVGVVSATGVAGLTLHGGMGFLTRRLGLACDSLIGAEVVTADGEVLQVAADRHADLLWALRGGGGNFGVVTRFTFHLHPAHSEVYMGIVMYPISEARHVVTEFRKYFETAPDEVMGVAIYWTTPHDEPVPPANRGLPTIVIATCWSGDPAHGEEMTRPMRTLAEPLVDLSGMFPFLVAQQLFDPEYPDGQRHYWKSIFLETLSDEAIDALTAQAASRPSSMTSVDIWALGGAARSEPAGGSAFAHRDKPYLIGYEANWLDPADDAANITWARRAFDEMQSFTGSGVYLNFPGSDDESSSIIDQTYTDKLARLQLIKSRYDPDNVFRSNFNITPAGAHVAGEPAKVRAKLRQD